MEDKYSPRYTLSELQPSQFYISEVKLAEIEKWFNHEDLSNFEPIPVRILDGHAVMTDGHTRAVAAIKAGLLEVPLVWEDADLDWDMYRECVLACREEEVHSATDLVDRIISAEEYHLKWDQWCDAMQSELLNNR